VLLYLLLSETSEEGRDHRGRSYIPVVLVMFVRNVRIAATTRRLVTRRKRQLLDNPTQSQDPTRTYLTVIPFLDLSVILIMD
jgi:hypothetical protein